MSDSENINSTAYQHLTPEQQQALATDKNISVTAGAGSGKTTILVERYLKIIIDEKIDIRNVLAITFTDKAAAEMTERVSRMIHERLQKAEFAAQRPQLLALRERLNSTQISTIHSFCARVLREFAVASGTDPDFAVLKDLQQDLLINESVEDVLEQLDTRELESSYTFEEWTELLRQVPPNTLRQVLATTLQHLYEMHRFREIFARDSDETIIEQLQAIFFTELEKHLNPEAFLAQVLPLLKHISKADVSRTALKENGQKAFRLIDEILVNREANASDVLLWQQLIDLAALMVTKSGTAFKTPTSIGKKNDLGDAYENILALSEAMLPLYLFSAGYSAVVPAELDFLNLKIIRKLLFLQELTERLYQEKKEERGALDFDDLQLRTLEVLQNHPNVRNTLRNRYRYIMVDEFQDTNQLQWEIISLMGIQDDELQSDKFFVVGDPKQSIYGFRSADVRVFQSVKADFAKTFSDPPDYPGNIVLQNSFRFLPSVNRFVNYLFRQILGSDRDNEFDVAYDDLYTRREAPDTGRIEVAFFDKEELRQKELSQEDYIAQKICGLLGRDISGEASEESAIPRPSSGAATPAGEGGIKEEKTEKIYHRVAGEEELRPVQPGDIAILIRQRTYLPELESTLRRYGVPFKTIGGIGFFKRQEIFDVYHLLRFLDNPSDDFALIALLRSPFAGISDAGLFHLSLEKRHYETYRERLEKIDNFSQFPKTDSKMLPRFREQLSRWELRRDRVSLSRLLSEILEESFYRATVAAEWNGEQLLANLDKIVEMARDYEQSGFTALADFIEMLYQTIILDPREGEAQIALEDEGTVKIMTIHQAKGLEFPIVFCPYLEQTPRVNTRTLRFDSDFGMAVKIRDPYSRYEEKAPFLHGLIEFREGQKQTAELKRLFYVAVTRARDQVYLVGAYKQNELLKENCLTWTLNALDINPEAVSENILSIDENLTVHLTTGIESAEPQASAYRDIKPSLQQLEDAINTPAQENVLLPIHLQPVADSPQGVTFSATQLLTFQSDPENYFRRYHLGFFEGDYEFLKHASDPDTLSLLKGKIVHQILEDGIPSSDAEMLEKLENAFFQWEVFDEEEQARLKTEIPALLSPFAKSAFAKKIFSAKEWKIEISLTMRLGNDFFTGTLDRIFRNPSGDWEVADYKTNNVTATQVAKAGAKYHMQMKAYALLMAQLYPGQSTYPVALYFLLPEKEYTKVYTPEDIANIQQEFLDLIHQIKRYWPFGEAILEKGSENGTE